MSLLYFGLSRKEQLQKQREYLKQKKQKKLVKMKELEEAREEEKSKWQSFNAKVLNTFWHLFIYIYISVTVSYFCIEGFENEERWNSKEVYLCNPRWPWW